MSDPAEIHAASLIERALEGSLDTNGRAELAALLRGDPQARRLLSQQLDLSNLLAEHYSGEDFVSSTVSRALAGLRSAVPPAIDAERADSARHRRSPSLRLAGQGGKPVRTIRGAALFARIALAAASVTLLVVGAWAVLGQSQPIATVTGGVGTLVRAGRDLAAAEGTELAAGDALCAVGGELAASYPDGTRLRLGKGSLAVLQPAEIHAAGKQVRLLHGRLDAEVAKQPAAAPMVIASGDAVATVLGTVLSFTTGDDGSRLEVSRGSVRLTRSADGAAVVVHSGEFARVAVGSELVARAIPAASDAPPAHAASKTVLLLRSHPDDDLVVEASLKALGCEVVVLDAERAHASDAEGRDLVVIPESVHAHEVGGKFRCVRVPVLTWEADIYRRMGFGGGDGKQRDNTTLTIRDPDSPLAAGLSGLVQVSQRPVEVSMIRARPTKAQVIATRGTSDDLAIFAYEAGQDMDGGETAPARRVGFFLEGDAEQQLTPEGLRLFDAAARWCLQLPQPSVSKP